MNVGWQRDFASCAIKIGAQSKLMRNRNPCAIDVNNIDVNKIDKTRILQTVLREKIVYAREQKGRFPCQELAAPLVIVHGRTCDSESAS